MSNKGYRKKNPNVFPVVVYLNESQFDYIKEMSKKEKASMSKLFIKSFFEQEELNN